MQGNAQSDLTVVYSDGEQLSTRTQVHGDRKPETSNRFFFYLSSFCTDSVKLLAFAMIPGKKLGQVAQYCP